MNYEIDNYIRSITDLTNVYMKIRNPTIFNKNWVTDIWI